MMRLTRTGIGLLTAQYRSVLKKCFLINAGLFLALAPSVAEAVDCSTLSPSSSAADIAACVGTFSYNKATINITDLAPSGDVNGWDGYKSTAIRNYINADNIARALVHTTKLAYHTISQDKSIIQNLEALDMLIGAYPSYNGMYTFANAPLLAKAKEEGWGVQSMDTGASILQNLVQLDFVVGGLQNGNYISNIKSMGGNIKALDTAIGAKQTGTYITGANVYSNLKALDTQVAANTSTIAAHTAVINALDNNYYRNIKVSRAEKLQKTSAVIVRSAKHDVTIFGRKSDKTAFCAEILQSLRSFRMTESVANDNTVTTGNSKEESYDEVI